MLYTNNEFITNNSNNYEHLVFNLLRVLKKNVSTLYIIIKVYVELNNGLRITWHP